MGKIVWCLAVVVAVSGCATASERYSALKEESLKARTLQEAIKASPPIKADVGQELKLDLEKSDDILLTPDGPSSFSYYVSYYRLYSFEAVSGKGYIITVKSFCGCFGFQKLVAVPEAYVVDGEGRLVSRVLRPVYQNGVNGALVGMWRFDAEENGQYFLVLAADNSVPGQEVGAVGGYALYVGWLQLPMRSSTTGSMTFRIVAEGSSGPRR